MSDAALRLSPLRVSTLTMDTPAGHDVEICCLADGASTPAEERYFLLDSMNSPGRFERCRGVVLPAGDAARVRAWLAAGAPCVLIGEAALRDPAIMESLSWEFGRERIGVYVPAARLRVSWSMDRVSNADFKFMAPSVCEPNWEVLMADGSRAGVFASRWIEEMTKRGASTVMVRADIEDDADLNLCAGLVEQCGERLWLGPLHREPERIADWIDHGHARQLVFPRKLYDEDDTVLALRASANGVEQRLGNAA